jgi:23S rRNA (cytidine1920-2'-O)/16S rRNA (cytidine1409-2'-O)-methyltransferase
VSHHFAETRSKAQAMIWSRCIRLSPDDIVDKPSRKIPANGQLIIGEGPKFVSRGGEKLERFLREFPLEIQGKTALDIGASTGGFTDCLLQRGALSVTCVDVGHGQLHYKLRKDPRVRNIENTNARDLGSDFFAGQVFATVVCDVSFISLKKILPRIWDFVAAGGQLIALIKPQFEAEKSYVDRCRGVIRDPAKQDAIRDDIINFATETLASAKLIGRVDSPISGADGNREFLFGLQKFAM